MRGYVTAVPTGRGGEVAVRIQTADGRLLVEAPRAGAATSRSAARSAAAGRCASPTPWEATRLERLGIREIARRPDRRAAAAAPRGGVAGAARRRPRSRPRPRSDSGTPAAGGERSCAASCSARTTASTRARSTTFKRSGLAHLLAVSGQNIVLLSRCWRRALLAARSACRCARGSSCVLALIAVYVPVTGAGPSIQRAGVMGAAGVVAALAGRPRSRWYALLLAAAATLALNPRASGDVGWQLSFAAVTGILLLAAPDLGTCSARRARHGLAPARLAEGAARDDRRDARHRAADGAPLRRRLDRAAAREPARAARGRADDVARDARRRRRPASGAPGRAADLARRAARRLRRAGRALARRPAGRRSTCPRCPRCRCWRATSALAARSALALRWSRGVAACSGRAATPSGPPPARGCRARGRVAARGGRWPSLAGPGAGRPAPGLRVTVLDVGQGDSILLEPRRRRAGAGRRRARRRRPVADQLDGRGRRPARGGRVTHDQADHVGGAATSCSARSRSDRLLYARARPGLPRGARAAGPRRSVGRRGLGGALREACGSRSLWPPASGFVDGPLRRATRTSSALVLLARWHGFRCCSPPTPRPRRCRSTRADRRAQGRPSRVATTPASARCSTAAVPRLAVISVGEREPLRPPDRRRPSPPWPSTSVSPVIRTDEAAT